MLYNIIYTVALILMTIGLIFLFYVVINKSLSSGKMNNIYTVIAGYEDKENLPDEIYSAFSQMSLFNFRSRPPVIVVDYDLTDETKLRCRIMNETCGQLVFCKEEELSQIIGNNIYPND